MPKLLITNETSTSLRPELKISQNKFSIHKQNFIYDAYKGLFFAAARRFMKMEAMKKWSIPYNPSAFLTAEVVLHYDMKVKRDSEKFILGDYFLLQIAKRKFELQQSNCDESVDLMPSNEIIPADFLRLHESPKSTYAPQVIYVRTS